jgi:hypothetical protein
MQRVPEAIDALNRCLDMSDESTRPLARVALAELLQDTAVNKPTEAIQQLELACKELENTDLAATLKAQRALAELHFKLNQRTQAINALSHALDLANALRSPDEAAIRSTLEAWKAGKTP